MNPSPNRQAVIVGLFFAGATAILAGAVLTIGDINDTFTRKITVTAVFTEVGGLQKGDNIWFSGVKVGTVNKLGFHGESEVEVVMRVDEDATPFIHGDVLAKLSSDGLIGSKIVVLYGGTSGAPGLVDGDVLAVGTAASTEEIMTMLQDNNKNLLAITTDLKGISGRIAAGEGTLGKLLSDEALYTGVSESVSTLGVASANAEALTASLSTFAMKLNREGGLPNDLATDRASYASLRTTVGELQQASTRASDLVDGLAKGAANPESPVGTLMHDKEAGGDLKATLDNLNRGSVLLNDDLEALQHNILLRGFFRKRARLERSNPGGTPAAQQDTE